MFTSSGPVRTTAVFVPELSFSTAQTSVRLALWKLAPGSEDCRISLHGQNKEQLYGMAVFLSVCIFLSLPTSAAAIPVIWYQDPAVCKSIQYSLRSLRQRTGRWAGLGWVGPGSGAQGGFDFTQLPAVETLPFSLASAEGQNTFLVPGQYPDFKPSLPEEGNCLRNSLLELVLYSCHT